MPRSSLLPLWCPAVWCADVRGYSWELSSGSPPAFCHASRSIFGHPDIFVRGGGWGPRRRAARLPMSLHQQLWYVCLLIARWRWPVHLASPAPQIGNTIVPPTLSGVAIAKSPLPWCPICSVTHRQSFSRVNRASGRSLYFRIIHLVEDGHSPITLSCFGVVSCLCVALFLGSLPPPTGVCAFRDDRDHTGNELVLPF